MLLSNVVVRNIYNKTKINLTFESIVSVVYVLLHQFLSLFVADHDSNVLPRTGAPVRIVIAFLGDF